MGMTLCFFVMGAPDLGAIVLIIELLALVILVKLTSSKDSASVTRKEIPANVAGIIFILLFLAIISQVIKFLPPFGQPLTNVAAYYLKEGLAMTDAANLVAAAALGFRGYDALAGISVLFLVAIGVLTIMSKEEKRANERNDVSQ
jgi:multisubunit Na+/H+ antiporter MnhB subunit